MTARTQSRSAAPPRVAQATRSRTAAALLIAGPVLFLLTEFIAATAWTDPPYSYTYHFISDLGVGERSTLFGQEMYSPLAWVMNTGFFGFGIVICVGVALLSRGLPARRRVAPLVPALLLAVGGVLIAVFHGSGTALEDGTGEFHAMGAFAGFIGLNTLTIVLGGRSRRLGLSRRVGRVLTTAGIIGLLSTVLYVAMIVSSGGDVLGVIGLIERGAVHPSLIALIVAGVAVGNRGHGGRT